MLILPFVTLIILISLCNSIVISMQSELRVVLLYYFGFVEIFSENIVEEFKLFLEEVARKIEPLS